MAAPTPTPRRRRRALAIVAATGAVALAVALPVFEPWKLVTNDVVDEAAPTSSPITSPAPVTARTTSPSASSTGTSVAPSAPSTSNEPVTLARGTFISHEHSTSGSVVVLRLADGSRVLRLVALDTSNGPDLHVWLSDQKVVDGPSGWTVFDDGRYVDLGPLKGNKGSQNYALPPSVDLSTLSSVSVWCARFHVSFGAAALSS